MLRQRLLLAIQNAGARNYGSASEQAKVRHVTTAMDEQCDPEPTNERPTCYLEVLRDKGHMEDLESFLARCGLTVDEAARLRGRSELALHHSMKDLLDLHRSTPDALMKALTAVRFYMRQQLS